MHFDTNGDFFAERTAWVGGDDGFLVVDRNGNGAIDDVTEMFGGPGESGFAELAAYDSNADGFITIDDAGFAELAVWRDINFDGQTDIGELKSLSDMGIASITATGQPLNTTTPQGVTLAARGTFTRTDGTTGNVFDAILETDGTDTIFLGEKGHRCLVGRTDAARRQGLRSDGQPCGGHVERFRNRRGGAGGSRRDDDAELAEYSGNGNAGLWPVGAVAGSNA